MQTAKGKKPVWQCCPLYDSNSMTFWKRPDCGSFPGGSAVEETDCQCRRPGFDPWVGKIPWKRAWQPTAMFLSGETHGQGSLVGYSAWDRRVGHDWVTFTHIDPHSTHSLSFSSLTLTHTGTPQTQVSKDSTNMVSGESPTLQSWFL